MKKAPTIKDMQGPATPSEHSTRPVDQKLRDQNTARQVIATCFEIGPERQLPRRYQHVVNQLVFDLIDPDDGSRLVDVLSAAKAEGVSKQEVLAAIEGWLVSAGEAARIGVEDGRIMVRLTHDGRLARQYLDKEVRQ